ncbi:MAG: hypothetical protein LBK47_05625 [Prevotellaceae bacterium]|jgi:hypothetical protein|nr:hypothetical protein [Prevotellaceae bacterium]
MKRMAILLGLAVFLTLSCVEKEQESQVLNISSTPCRQGNLKSSGFSDKVDVEFINKGAQITHYNFEVTCDFTTVDITHTFVNGVLNITQQGSPNQANCICYTDVSYTINGISQDEVNVIFINEVQVYCYNENYPIEIPFEDYSLAGTPCQWTMLNNDNDEVVVINSNEELNQYITCTSNDYPAIDFSKYTLLLAHGTASSSVVSLGCSRLQQISEQGYTMNVDIVLGNATVMSDWQTPIIINKMGQESNVELKINTGYTNNGQEIENPLTDLPWLKTIVDETVLVIQNGNPLSVSIYQCVYGNSETGFLVDKGNIKPFYNYNGEILCIMGGDAGETCSELNIVGKKLIWEIEKNILPNSCEFDNPLEDLPWLKAKVDETVLAIQNGTPQSVSIYRCVYGDSETGFLIDKGNIKPFYNCNGEILCIMGGDAGETCSELNIVGMKLIWEIKTVKIQKYENDKINQFVYLGIILSSSVRTKQ